MTGFLENLTTTSNFFFTKCDFICRDMLICKITKPGGQIIRILSKKLHYTQLKLAFCAQFLNVDSVQFFFFFFDKTGQRCQYENNSKLHCTSGGR